MNKVIDDFTRSIESKRAGAARCPTMDKYSARLVEFCDEVMISSEYIALKALSEQKIVVTDEMIVEAARAYNKHFDESGFLIESIETALRVVFDIVNKESANNPVEEKPEKERQRFEGWVEEKPLDAGWIKPMISPPCHPDTIVDLKQFDGSIIESRKASDVWPSPYFNNYVAYRIVPEPVVRENRTTQKQTLYEFIKGGEPYKPTGAFVSVNDYADWILIKNSEYLERLK